MHLHGLLFIFFWLNLHFDSPTMPYHKMPLLKVDTALFDPNFLFSISCPSVQAGRQLALTRAGWCFALVIIFGLRINLSRRGASTTSWTFLCFQSLPIGSHWPRHPRGVKIDEVESCQGTSVCLVFAPPPPLHAGLGPGPWLFKYEMITFYYYGDQKWTF